MIDLEFECQIPMLDKWGNKMDISVQLGAVVGFIAMAIGCIGSCIICGSGAGKDFDPAYYINFGCLILIMIGVALMVNYS